MALIPMFFVSFAIGVLRSAAFTGITPQSESISAADPGNQSMSRSCSDVKNRKGEGATLKTLCNSMSVEIAKQPPHDDSKATFPKLTDS